MEADSRVQRSEGTPGPRLRHSVFTHDFSGTKIKVPHVVLIIYYLRCLGCFYTMHATQNSLLRTTPRWDRGPEPPPNPLRFGPLGQVWSTSRLPPRAAPSDLVTCRAVVSEANRDRHVETLHHRVYGYMGISNQRCHDSVWRRC
jgi:hypothetical protein